MNILVLFIQAVVIYLVAALIYLKCNKGMARNARGQQLRRLLITTIIAVLPMGLSGQSLCRPDLLAALAIGALWMITYPLLFHLTHRSTSPDYENYMDITFGIYLFGWLSALTLFCPWSWLMSLIEIPLLLVPLVQIVYYLTYKVCFDANSMKLVQETDMNEVVEFFRSFHWWQNLLMVLPIVLLLAGLCVVNSWSDDLWVYNTAEDSSLYLLSMLLVAGLLVFMTVYIFKPHHGVFVRTGVAGLYHDVKEYVTNNRKYVDNLTARMSQLTVEPLGRATEKPHTMILVIGESACRDFMSAFHPDMEEDTTPWMRSGMEVDAKHFIGFPHAYSCTMQTVPTLEKALTEYSQYNDKAFYDSCSFIDIAHQLGYKVHWYSNQGTLGAADTPITLVANTADTAKWTRQELNRVQYDGSLLNFLDEVDPSQNNLVVFHLMGSHFNFLNRYPADQTIWGRPGVQDNVVNYKNSLAYTDSVLHRIHSYAKEKLNLEAMVYFSDHATEPGRRRKPNFEGFQMVRIPLLTWVSDDYIACHPERYEALLANRDKFFTNDLIYDLMCGLLDVRSNHFDEAECLASKQYRYTRDMLLTYEGKKHISEDTDERK